MFISTGQRILGRISPCLAHPACQCRMPLFGRHQRAGNTVVMSVGEEARIRRCPLGGVTGTTLLQAPELQMRRLSHRHAGMQKALWRIGLARSSV